jgi:hypothetical protein
MTVTQTILAGREDGVPGNCIQAAVASLLDLPIDAVPHFLLWEQWNVALAEWLTERGYTIRCRYTTEIPRERCIVAGVSPRGIAHASASPRLAKSYGTRTRAATAWSASTRRGSSLAVRGLLLHPTSPTSQAT